MRKEELFQVAQSYCPRRKLDKIGWWRQFRNKQPRSHLPNVRSVAIFAGSCDLGHTYVWVHVIRQSWYLFYFPKALRTILQITVFYLVIKRKAWWKIKIMRHKIPSPAWSREKWVRACVDACLFVNAWKLDTTSTSHIYTFWPAKPYWHLEANFMRWRWST